MKLSSLTWLQRAGCLVVFLAGILETSFGKSGAAVQKKTSTASYLIPAPNIKRNASKNDIKEEIGHSMKEALQQCTKLLKTVGQLQIDLARVQKQLFAKIEELIDNKKPFKKANRIELKRSLAVMQRLSTKLSGQVQAMREVKIQLNNDTCLKCT